MRVADYSLGLFGFRKMSSIIIKPSQDRYGQNSYNSLLFHEGRLTLSSSKETVTSIWRSENDSGRAAVEVKSRIGCSKSIAKAINLPA